MWHRHWRRSNLCFAVYLSMMLGYHARIIAYHKYSAYRKSSDMPSFRNTGFLQQMQASAPASDKDEFCSMAFDDAVVVTHLQFP
ncbi:hypothetical protein D3C78_1308270 [compost metagenome]